MTVVDPLLTRSAADQDVRVRSLVRGLFGPRETRLGPGFLDRYREAFATIQGGFSFDGALFFFAYAELLARAGIAADTLEIGVHHGLSAIAVAALRGEGRRFVAVDLFEEGQSENRSASMSGERAVFLANLGRFHGNLSFTQVVAGNSMALEVADLGTEFSFVHVDGGHSAEETYHDVALAAGITLPGGLVAVDDYFNPAFPGVAEGAILYERDHPGVLTPIAIGFNKVLLQRTPAPFDLKAAFAHRWRDVQRWSATLWRSPVPLFGLRFAPYVDLERSAPGDLRPRRLILRADLTPQRSELRARPGTMCTLPVLVRNRSSVPFEWSENPFGLSYHLRAAHDGEARFENARAFFREPLAPGDERIIELPVSAPTKLGSYRVEVDLVWEGITWFADQHNRTASVPLFVADP